MTIIYLDMDGVIADFEKHIVNSSGRPFKDLERGEMYRIADQEGFFATIPPMDDMELLLEGLLKHDLPISILSATGHRTPERVLKEKNAWLDKHLSNYPIQNRHFVERSAMKAVHATPDSILIDDRTKAFIPFTEAGGNAILHSDAKSTLEILSDLLLGMA